MNKKPTPYAASMGRRDFLRTVGIGTVATAAGPALWTEAVSAAGEKTLVWAKPLETIEFDPHVAILGSSWQLLHVVYDALIDMDDDMNPIPGMAESWEQPDDTTYIFKLRPGLTFSNGRAVTEEDVIGSLKRVLDPETGSFWRLEMGPVTEFSVPGERLVQVKLSNPYAPFLHALSATMTSIIPMKELEAGEFDPTKELLGSGPFMVESHAQDEQWVLKRNPHYWKEGLPVADELIVRIMPQDPSRIAALRDGTAHIATFEASPDAPLVLKSVPNVEVIIEDVTNYYYLGLNAVWDKSPFRDQKLRQAVALSLDRNQIKNLALGGAGDPTASIAPNFGVCSYDKLGYWNRDIDRARAIVKEIGAEGLSFDFMVRNIPADIQMAQVIKQNVEEIGLTTNIEVVDQATAVKRCWVDNPSIFQATVFWYAGYSDPTMVTLWWDPELAGFTAGHVPVDPAIKDAIQSARLIAADDPARGGMLQKLCNLIDDQAVKIPLVTRKDTIAVRKDMIADVNIKHIEGYGNTLRG
ncbi:MAG: ABC transporter substrate-binding protein, partial [Gammaproteobacteria bacterium]